jgi:cytochrome o ubiquinol oxidase subunit 1
MFGKLTWAAIPFNQPIPLVAGAVVGLMIFAVLILATVKGWMPYLWREWITSVDHKRVGIMYTLLAMVMLVRGFTDAIMMRTQQAMALNSDGFLPPEHFSQIFSAHGTLMIFFVAMPFLIGLMNFVVPLQLGVRDVAFPTLNSVSFWLTATGALLVNLSLLVGEFSRTGWLPYPPLSEITYSPGVGVDYYLWSLQISGIGTLLTGINFVTTILKMHAPGMTYLRMPMFCWTALASNLLIVAAFPVLTATLAMLLLDRYLGFHFFTNEAGGNVMMFMNLIWAWGHPEVYILVLPAFGVFSEVVSTFSGKPLFNYRSMVTATMVICILAFMVWLHHFFTMGAGADVNAVFGIATMIIAVPTGVKVFNWLFTMYRGRVVYATPMLWALAFMVTFVIGGMTGVLLAVPPADFVLHNSLFLVAHFHNVIIGGVLFGAFAGYNYWWPKAFGFRLHDGLGKAAFWCWLVGFYVAFMPLYVLGLMGMTRRMQHYNDPAWRPWLIVAGIGALIILAGIVLQITQIVVSIRRRESLRDEFGDPWNGRSLEWATPSPPPAFNFAVLPNVQGEEAYWGIKQRAIQHAALADEPAYTDIEMPRNSPTGFVCAFFATLVGFALIWHIWWMVAVGLLGAFATFVVFAWRDEGEYVIPAEEVARIDRANRNARRAALGQLQNTARLQTTRELQTQS